VAVPKTGIGLIKNANDFLTLRRFKMEQHTNKIQGHEDTKKLSFVIVFLSLFVIVLFGLAPIV
jgi:hypothetical protein